MYSGHGVNPVLTLFQQTFVMLIINIICLQFKQAVYDLHIIFYSVMYFMEKSFFFFESVF